MPYNESEQRTAFYTMIEDNVALTLQAKVLGVRVTVKRIDMNAADEIVAICHRRKEQS